MKYIKQLLIILTISLLGEILKIFIPLPIPASIYGMAILFTCLMTGIIKLESIKETGKFLIEVMPIMFIPAGVGLMDSFPIIRPIIGPIAIITVVALITVMFSTGWVSQHIIRKKGEKHE